MKILTVVFAMALLYGCSVKAKVETCRPLYFYDTGERMIYILNDTSFIAVGDSVYPIATKKDGRWNPIQIKKQRAKQ